MPTEGLLSNFIFCAPGWRHIDGQRLREERRAKKVILWFLTKALPLLESLKKDHLVNKFVASTTLLLTFTMKLQGFSYLKLTALQVQGARERSNRQVEASQLSTRLAVAEKKWKSRVERAPPQQEDVEIFSNAIREAFEDRDISLFMVARLAELCRQEYQSIQTEEGLRRLNNDYRVSINWMYQEIEKVEKEKVDIEEDLKSRIEALRQEVEEAKKKRQEDLKENLRWKRQELLRIREQLMKRLKEAKQQMECSKSPKPMLVKKCSEGSDWVDIDDDHFATSGGSGWVVCSYRSRAMYY
jgi:hypothetical protein